MSAVPILIDQTQFSEAVERDIVESLRTGAINHKLHYLSYKQTAKWLRLHESFSPARNDTDCLRTYDRAFAAVGELIKEKRIAVVGLGCGGGQKDVQCLKSLRKRGKAVAYTPVDVSAPMVVTAHRRAGEVSGVRVTAGVVCDLVNARDIGEVFKESSRGRSHSQEITDAARLVTFFGMMPNFEPDIILPRLAALVGKSDYLLLSANLAPGDDYQRGVERVLPQYANKLTNDWLVTFLTDFGMEPGAGEVRWEIERTREKLFRIRAEFVFLRNTLIVYEGQRFKFAKGKKLRLFYSYRYTPALMRRLLAGQGIEIVQEWITKSEEEGVFLARKAPITKHQYPKKRRASLQSV